MDFFGGPTPLNQSSRQAGKLRNILIAFDMQPGQIAVDFCGKHIPVERRPQASAPHKIRADPHMIDANQLADIVTLAGVFL
jgi:hypothetical protein